jgi:hypothetical protein
MSKHLDYQDVTSPSDSKLFIGLICLNNELLKKQTEQMPQNKS